MVSNEWIDRWIGIAEKRFEIGNYSSAIRHYSYVLSRIPTNTRALIGRGDAWMKKGDYIRAFTDYDKAFRLEPENEDIARSRTLALALQSSEKERIALKEHAELEHKKIKEHFEAERKAIAERLEEEYRKKLEEELDTVIEQITADPEELRKEARRNMDQSERFRIYAVMTVCAIPVWILVAFITLGSHQIFGAYAPFVWLPLATASAFPLVMLMWLFLRWRYEAKILSYAFHRKVIVEDRINAYFRGDSERFKKMLKIYITHWIDKSPVELMLDIGGRGKGKNKRKGKSDIPTEILLDKLTELAKVIKLRKSGS